MRKIILFISLLFIVTPSFACKYINENIDISDKFQKNCYEFLGEINKKTNCGYSTALISSDKKIDTFLNSSVHILPHKLYKNSGENIDYSINIDGNKKYLQDNNSKTFLEIDTKNNKEVIIELDNVIKSKSYDFIFNYKANHHSPQYYISEDGISYSKIINKNDINDFDVKFVKIVFKMVSIFDCLAGQVCDGREKIQITELNLKSKNYQYIVKSDSDIIAYSNNLCKNNNLNLSNSNSKFQLNTETKTIKLELTENPDYNIFVKKDSDNDGVEDKNDNCLNIYNPFQKDRDGNGKGDLCSDDDSDGIIGEKDNCIYISNSNQKDINQNGVGDVCEFDKDEDSIFDSLDNCVTKYNPNQEDKDRDGIGDICDNSIYYNPKQIDKNNNGIGDITEEKEKKLKENDDDSDGIINYKDNCKSIANPNQEDSDKDGVGNICDNSPYYNPKQVDENNNGIGDISEDSDNDGIEGLKDNCINIANSNQKDSDNNGIGDLCEDKDYDKILFANDNCPYDYNPDQKDIDEDQIGDICDKDDNRYIESNKTFFIGLLIFITIIFGGGIYMMIRKLRK